MKLLSVIAGALSLVSLSSASSQTLSGPSRPPVDLEDRAFARVKELQAQYTRKVTGILKKRKTGCTDKNVVRRREWGSTPRAERAKYIEALYCMARLPSKIDRSVAPGARNRLDDFTATHALLTLYIHGNGPYLSWHRYFIHLFEKALRDECGYKGTQPYWDWSLSWRDPASSSILDGSPWSLGSNGAYIPNREPAVAVDATGFQSLMYPGTGGGCVERGPLSADKFHVNLGPISFLPTGPDGGFGYNPRCLTRDISLTDASDARPSNVTKLLDCPDYECFVLQQDDWQGLHGAGHFIAGGAGGLMSDGSGSPGDPIFFSHHAQLDRLWAIWQYMTPGRFDSIWGTLTYYNTPPTPDATLDTPMSFGILAPNITIKDGYSTIDGPFCYIYV